MSQDTTLSAREIAGRVRLGDLKATDITREALGRAATTGRELNAFITLCESKALAQAATIDAMPADARSRMPLAGVPIALKDNISYTDYPMTCGSHILEGYVPPYDATVVTRLIAAGAVIIGKTNLDEFAMGSSNENSYFGPVKNPVDPTRAPGGSSGGSAAAVAAGIVPLALGSETGGSVRQPASFCGLFGLKPTYGAVSRYGLTAFASSTDQISPFARSVDDLALVFGVIAGRDENDSTSVAIDHPDFGSLSPLNGTLSIGLPKEYAGKGLDPEVGEALESARQVWEGLGHRCVDISLPLTSKAIPTYYVISSAEASANLARFDGVRYGLRERTADALEQMYSDTRAEGFGDEVKRRIMLGTYTLSAGYYDAYYIKAAQVRELMRREFEESFMSVDLIMSPTAPSPAFRLGEKITDPLAMYLSDVFTVPASLAGIPAMSVPFASARNGLPIGIQLMARHFDETSLFQAAHALHSAR